MNERNDTGGEEGMEDIKPLPNFIPSTLQKAIQPDIESVPTESEHSTPSGQALNSDEGNHESTSNIKRVKRGRLVEHNSAPYQNDPNNSASYFVKYLDDEGRIQTVWGIDLQRAMTEAGVSIGHQVELHNLGRQRVIVQAPVLDKKGEIIGYEDKETHLNIWKIEALPEAIHKLEPNSSTPQSQNKEEAATLQALLNVAKDVEAGKVHSKPVSNNDLERINAFMQQHPQGLSAAPLQSQGSVVPATTGGRYAQQGSGALVEGGAALIGGAGALGGAVLKGIGSLANTAAGLIKKEETPVIDALDLNKTADLSGVMILPRLSEFRVSQVEKSAQTYADEQDAFWKADPKLLELRKTIEDQAKNKNIPVLDVIQGMQEKGDAADLRCAFNEAITSSPEAQKRIKSMDKALSNFLRQYGRAQEELLNPETNGGPHYGRFKERLQHSLEALEKKTQGIPAMLNASGQLDSSHFEKLRESIAKIMERLKEVAQTMMDMLRGRKTSVEEESSHDGPRL